MAGIKEVPIRACISISDTAIYTPYILSFTVHKKRGESTTFDASVKIDRELAGRGAVKSKIIISAGSSELKVIFTGYIKSAKLAPCWDDPGYSVLSISGADKLSTISKATSSQVSRVRDPEFVYCEITGVICRGEKSDENAGDGYSDKHLWLDHGELNSESAPYSTNIDVRAVSGIGSVVGGDTVNETVHLQVDLLS